MSTQLGTAWIAPSFAAPVARTGIQAVMTMDLHESDLPADIDLAAETLATAGVRVTVFVPSAMLGQERFHSALRRLVACGHELESHSHHHDWTEIEALMSGGPDRLGFLEESRTRHEDFFGRTPTAFRSPCWCVLGPAARDELARLDYRVDCSATPQRPPFLSSFPFRAGWMASPRAPHLLRPDLLEIPTSTFLVPLGAPTVLTFRGLAKLMLATLSLEALAFPDRVLVLQSHAEDWNPDSSQHHELGRLRFADFLPSAQGGFGFKRFLRSRNPRRIAEIYWDMLRHLSRFELVTVLEARAAWERRQALVPVLA